MKKIEFGTQFVTQNINIFRCPICDQPFQQVEGTTLQCPNGHGFDISKKGTLYFLTHHSNNEYDSEMLTARNQILRAGLFDPIIKAIYERLDSSPETILDVGCGEGTPLAKLMKLRQAQDVAVGFDISKDGINLATQHGADAFFCVADLAHLPFNDDAFSMVIDLFSPSAYDEFNRVIKPGGQLIKIIPNSHYLHELRELLFGADQPNSSYSNQKVYDLFFEHYPDATVHQLRYSFQIPAGLQRSLMIMTPLHWGKNQNTDAARLVENMKSVTVDVSILTQQFN